MSQENPYRSPVEQDPSTGFNSAHAIIGAWEQLRLLFNVILGGLGLVVLAASLIAQPMQILEMLVGAVGFGVFANICFCAGPGVELYLCYLRKKNEVPGVRIPLFVLGTLVSLVPIGWAALMLVARS